MHKSAYPEGDRPPLTTIEFRLIVAVCAIVLGCNAAENEKEPIERRLRSLDEKLQLDGLHPSPFVRRFIEDLERRTAPLESPAFEEKLHSTRRALSESAALLLIDALRKTTDPKSVAKLVVFLVDPIIGADCEHHMLDLRFALDDDKRGEDVLSYALRRREYILELADYLSGKKKIDADTMRKMERLLSRKVRLKLAGTIYGSRYLCMEVEGYKKERRFRLAAHPHTKALGVRAAPFLVGRLRGNDCSIADVALLAGVLGTDKGIISGMETEESVGRFFKRRLSGICSAIAESVSLCSDKK